MVWYGISGEVNIQLRAEIKAVNVYSKHFLSHLCDYSISYYSKNLCTAMNHELGWRLKEKRQKGLKTSMLAISWKVPTKG